MRVAILAQFPLHLLPEFAHFGEPTQHYATWLPQLAESFASTKGLEFHWVTLTTQVDRPRTCQWQGQTFHLLPTAPSKRASTFFYRDRLAIRQCLQEIRPDLVHGWGTEDVYAFASAEFKGRNIASVQGLLSEYMLHSRLPARTYFQALLELITLNRSQALVCESLWAKEKITRRLLNKQKPIHHIEYGVQRIFYNAVWKPDPEKPVAVFCGSAEPRKGIQDLIKVFSSPPLREMTLFIIGSNNSSFASQLKSASTNNIQWLGRLPIAETLQFLEQAWCMILPTRGDTGPMAVKEAQVVGLPVISTYCSGAMNYIENGINGFLTSPNNIVELQNLTLQLLTDFALAQKMGQARHEQQRKYFHPDRTTSNLVALYQQTVNHASQTL